MFTEETDKIEFSSNDDKRLQTFVKVTSYPCHANVRKVCKRELLQYLNINIK